MTSKEQGRASMMRALPVIAAFLGAAVLVTWLVGCDDERAGAPSTDTEPVVFKAEHGNYSVRRYSDEAQHVICYVVTGPSWDAVGISCLRELGGSP